MTKKTNGEKDEFNFAKGARVSTEEINRRLTETRTEDELDEVRHILIQEGVPEKTVSARVSELKKKGKLSFLTPTGKTEEEERGVVVREAQPVEEIIRNISIPAFADGQRVVFESGMHFGMNCIIGGVRLAQELSRMGIAQATPVIRMASEMRKAEGASAREAGQIAAEETMARALGYLDEGIEKATQGKKTDIASVPNPMQGIMARVAEKMMEGVMGTMMPGGKTSGQQQLPSGWEDNR